jgi:hypothetical protein
VAIRPELELELVGDSLSYWQSMLRLEWEEHWDVELNDGAEP